jgi:tRNA_anti-like
LGEFKMKKLPAYLFALAGFSALPAHAESFKMSCFPDHAAPYTVTYVTGADGTYITGSRSGTTRRYDVIDLKDNRKNHVLYLATHAPGQTRTVYLAFDYSQIGNDVSDIRVIDSGYDATDKCSFIPKEVYQAQRSTPAPSPAQGAAPPVNATPAQPVVVNVYPNATTQTQDKPAIETGRSISMAPLGEQDIANMHTSYDDNQARFRRDYIGRQFSANLPIHQVSESGTSSAVLVISLGTGTPAGDVTCTVSGDDNIRAATELHKGQLVHVAGIIDDHSSGSIDLRECQISQ